MEYEKDTVIYKVVNNHELRADVYRPRSEEIRSAVIWIHGGALIFGTREWLTSTQLEMYLEAGYTVISIDYRLAPESKLPAIIEDLKDAYTWVRVKGSVTFNIDPDRIAVVGHSAGGYLTLMAGFVLRPRPRVLVSFYGYGNLTKPWYTQPDSFYNQMPTISREQALESIGDSLISSTPVVFSPEGRYQFYVFCRQNGLWPWEVCGRNPEIERSWYSAYEPLRNVTSAYPPTLLLHGEKDTDVPFDESVHMAQALRQHNVEHELVSGANWGHMFDEEISDPTVMDAFGQVFRFLEKHISLK